MKIKKGFIAIKPDSKEPFVEGDLLFVTTNSKTGKGTGDWNIRNHLGDNIPYELVQCTIIIDPKPIPPLKKASGTKKLYQN
jgi:hypothetical protein